jgi:hypothetical protein
VSSAYCDYSANVCRSYVSAGNSCAAGLQCESGLYCDPATVRCKAYPTAPSPVGGSCAAPAFCDQTVAWCDSTTTCRAYVPAGGACNGYDQCGFASFCRGYTGGATSGTCARLGDVGSSCRTGASECLGGLYCDAPAGSAIATPGKCKAMSGIGGTCGQVNTGEYADCLSGQCDYGSPPAPTGTCVGYVGPGGNCSRLSCDPFQYLVCTAGTCAPTTYCHP